MTKQGRSGIAAIGLTLVATLSLATGSQAADGAKTKVYFDNAVYGQNETIFSGRVESGKTSCEKDRKVTVYRKKRGKDTKFGTATAKTRSMEGGRAWQLTTDGYALSGTYYAKSKDIDGCNGDRSNEFELFSCMPVNRQFGQCRAVR